MNDDLYIEELASAATEISSHFRDTVIRGVGNSSFLIASNGKYGIELYRDENGLVIVDPSMHDELLGEREYSDFKDAVQAALRWLKNGEIDEINSGT